MSDSTPIDTLLNQYEEGIDDPSASVDWLNARSELEGQLSSLTDEQRKNLAVLDRELASKSRSVAAELGDKLTANRAGKPSSHWWWYLDVLAPAASSLAPKPPSDRERLINAIINGVLVIALLVAAGFAAVRFGIIPTPVAPSATPRPSSTPLPTATLDPVAFNFAAAKPVESPNKVIVVSIPDGWTALPSNSDKSVGFTYGPAEAPRAVFQLIVEDTSTIYNSTLGVVEAQDTPQAALTKFKADLPASSGFVAGDVTDSTIGAVPGAALRITAPANPQAGTTEATEYEIRAAHLTGGKAALIIMQADASVWDTVKPVLDQVAQSVVVTPGNIPTATPTPTLHPLQITATYVQTQILALTPSATPTLTLTPTAGTPAAGSTAEATAAATTEATPAAPAATAEATAEATP